MRVLLLDIGTDVAKVPPVSPPLPPQPSTWSPPPMAGPSLPTPTGLHVQAVADGVLVSWMPSTVPKTSTVLQVAPDAAGAPGAWADLAATQDAQYTLTLPAAPQWVRVRARLNGIQSLPSAALLATPVSVAGVIDDVADLLAKDLLQDQAIAQEIIDRAAADAQVQIDAAQDATAKVAIEANARANAIIAERNAWTAAVEQETTLRETEDESLAIALSLVSAGSGEQFDSRKIWYYDTALESWTGNGTPTVVDGWLRPANHASDPYVASPTGLAIEGQSYRFVKLRIKKVGSPVWDGAVRWRKTGDGAGVWSGPATIPAPSFDAAGVTAISWQDIGWWPATIDQIRVDLSTAQTATDYFLIDWVAIGRPTPGAGVALVQDETAARVAGDSAEATQRTTLAVQMRGAYTGTDVAGVSTGLVYSERQARINADGVIATDVTSLQARMPAGSGLVATEASVTTEATARATADSALATRATTLEARMPAGAGILATVANVTDEATARANADGALATRTGVIEARMPTGVDKLANEARVVTAETAAATATGAVSTRLGTVEARMPAGAGGLATSASVNAVDQARVDGDGALATSITQVKAALGGGGNLLPNSDFSTNNAGLGDWGYSSGVSGGFYPRTAIPGPTYLPAATGGVYLRSPGALAGTTYLDILSNRAIDIDTTKDYILSVYLSAHRCVGFAYIRWQDSSGASLAYSAATTIATSGAGGTLASLTRVFVKATPPAGAVTALILIRARGNSSTGYDSFLFIAAPMLEEAAGVAQTTPSPYSAGVAGLGAIAQIAQVTADAATGKINAAITTVLDVDGNVSGTRSENDGTVSKFSILATIFRVLGFGSSGMEWQDGYLRIWKGASQIVLGNSFGAIGDLILWYGPNIAVNTLTKSNGTIWFDTSSGAYFGGTLSAGVRKNAAQSTQVSSTAYVETGIFGTGGNQKVVVYSIIYVNQGSMATLPWTGGASKAQSVTMTLQRSYNGGAWTTIGTQTVTNTATYTGGGGGDPYFYNATFGGAATFTDNLAGTSTFNYRLALSAASNMPLVINGSQGTQSLSLVSQESP